MLAANISILIMKLESIKTITLNLIKWFTLSHSSVCVCVCLCCICRSWTIYWNICLFRALSRTRWTIVFAADNAENAIRTRYTQISERDTFPMRRARFNTNKCLPLTMLITPHKWHSCEISFAITSTIVRLCVLLDKRRCRQHPAKCVEWLFSGLIWKVSSKHTLRYSSTANANSWISLPAFESQQFSAPKRAPTKMTTNGTML